MDKIKEWEKTFDEDRLTEILQEAEEYLDLSIKSKSLKIELERKKPEEDKEIPQENKVQLEVVNYFVHRLLPLLVKTVLKKKISDGGKRSVCTDFLKHVLRLVCAWIELDELTLLKLVMEIFNEDCKFYSTGRYSGEYSRYSYNQASAVSPSCDSPLTEADSGTFASPLKIFSKSSLLVDLINYFGEECKGFEKIVERISHNGSETCPKIKVEHVLYYLKVVDELRRILKEEFIEKYSMELKNAVFDLILNFTADELKATTKVSLVHAVEFLSSILMISHPTPLVGEITERFQLDVSLKCLESPSLEKRLQGLQVITGLIDMVDRKEAPKYAKQYRAYYPGGVQSRVALPTTKWLTSEIFTEWLDTNKIIDELFGDKMHQELLKRSNPIFKFLTTKKKLTTEHIDLVWNSCLGKQEQVMAASFLIISDLVEDPEFGNNLITYLMNKIVEFPVKDYDTNFIKLLGNIEESCLAKGIHTYLGFPMEVLWKTVQDNSGASEEVFTEAMQVLLSILEKTRGMKTFLKFCIANLESHKSVPQSLQALKALLKSYPNRVILHSNSDNVEKVIASMENKHQIVDLFFKDFIYYHEAASHKSKKIASEKAGSSRFCGGYYPHLQRVQIHLDFLEYIMSRCELPLPKEDLSALWECIIEKPLCPEEQTLGFTWFSTFCDKTRLDESLLEYLFEQKICALNFANITKPGYECFEQLFFSINRSKQKLSSSYSRNFQVTDINLTGMESLWKIILVTLNEEVSDKAVTFLSSMYEQLAPNLKSQQTTLRENLIRKIMKELGTASSLQLSAGLEQARFRIERCLMLLQKFIELFDRPPKGTPVMQVQQMPLSIVLVSEARDLRFSFSVYGTDTLSDLCEKVAKTISRNSQTKTSGDQITLNYLGQPLNKEMYPFRTLAALKVKNSSTFMFKVEKSSSSQTADCSPKFFLVNNTECFDQLYELLDFNEIIGAKVWDLISELPVNPTHYDQMKNIDETSDWEQLLPTHSTLQLLYSLQIILSIINPKCQTLEALEDQKQWCKRFDKGFKRLLEIFQSYQTLIKGSSANKCIESILSIINNFMLTTKETEDGAIRYVLKENLEFVNFSSLITQLLHVIWDSSRASADALNDSDEPGDDIVKHGGTLLVAILFSDSSLLNVLYSFDHLKEFVHSVTLEAKASVRDEMATGICQLCLVLSQMIQAENLDPRTRFIPMLLEFLPNIPYNSQTCTEYFAATNKLIKSILQPDGTFDCGLNEKDFLELLVRLIKEHPIVEPNESSHTDLVIIGLMTLLETLLSARPIYKQSVGMEFTKYLFKDCLFAIPTAESAGVNPPPTCKSAESRKAAFSLLRVLVDGCDENYQVLLHLITETHLQTQESKFTEWNYSPASEQRSDVGYVGIKNLGCICYMNSLLQQLFMMPKFRKGILSLPQPDDSKEDPLEDNLLYQLQVMFSNLQESYRQYFDPSNFCKANKDYDGQPTDVSLQMDADEFFNMMCEKVEEGLKRFSKEKLLKNIWCGNLCSQLICQECKTNSERDEAFFTVSLDIKDKQSISEALEFYVQGELLTGNNKYSCEKCDKKVDALMRRCLKTLPSTLILHLKRFEFNFDTMRKLKLNDYCEFPMTLNMKAYTKEGIQEMEELQEQERQVLRDTNSEMPADGSTPSEEPEENSQQPTNEDEPKNDENKAKIQPDDYYNYELVGILVHRGVADSGHYYSFIKLRNTGSKDPHPQWVEFNDEIVRPFDPADIEKECFGGSEQIGDGRFAREVNRTRNAYMLIYERKDSATIEETEEQVKSDSPLIQSRKAQENFAVSVPKNLYENVWSDNMKFLMDKKLFDVQYASFCYDLLNLTKFEEDTSYTLPNPDNVKFQKTVTLIQFFLGVLLHSKESKLIQEYSQCIVANIFSRSIPACRWFLGKCTPLSLRHWLLECTEPEPRLAVVNMINTCVARVLPLEYKAVPEDDSASEPTQENSECTTIANCMLKLLTRLPHYWRNFNEYFLFFEHFASLNERTRQFLHKNDFFIKIVSLIHCGSVDRKPAPKMGDKFDSPSYAHAIGALAFMIRGSTGAILLEEEDEESSESAIGPNPYALPGEKIEISPDHIRSFFNENFLKEIMEEKNSAIPLSSIICFLSWESQVQTDYFLKFVRTGVNDAEFEGIETWFKLVGPIMDIEDSFRLQRINYMFSQCIRILEKFKKYPKYTRNLITCMFKVYEENKDVRQWMDEQRQAWHWIEKWMSGRGFPIPGLTSSDNADNARAASPSPTPTQASNYVK